mgnify:CR=1 FL=1
MKLAPISLGLALAAATLARGDDASVDGDNEFDERVPIPDLVFDKSEQLRFEKEMLGLYVSDHPLLGLDNVLCTPHLGASTSEAQERVAVEIAELPMSIRGYGHVKHENVQEAQARLEALLANWPGQTKRIAA